MDRSSIVMYHYVRNLKETRYPDIKGLDANDFEIQIKFFKENFNIITMEELIYCTENNLEIPPKSLLLTFDDGYIDNYITVFPVLKAHDIQGSFFVPSLPIEKGELLDVNKIHFTLASGANEEEIILDIFNELDMYRSKGYKIEANDVLFSKLAKSNRFDSEKIIFIKRLLQCELEFHIREKISSKLFKKYVGVEENVFAKELYMDIKQMKLMKDCGMHFGIHGHSHQWLGKVDCDVMKREINKSLDFFNDIVDKDNLTICYPYGSYNNDVIKYIQEKKFKLGFTTEVKKLPKVIVDKYKIPRLDTNDFPPKSNKFVEM